MKILVKVKANAKKDEVVPPLPKLFKVDGNDYYKVSVKAPPIQGKANTAVLKLLSIYFKISPSQVILISGQTSKTKVFKINI